MTHPSELAATPPVNALRLNGKTPTQVLLILGCAISQALDLATTAVGLKSHLFYETNPVILAIARVAHIPVLYAVILIKTMITMLFVAALIEKCVLGRRIFFLLVLCQAFYVYVVYSNIVTLTTSFPRLFTITL